MRLIVSVFCLFVLSNGISFSQEKEIGELIKLDSVPLFTSTKYFNYFFADNYTEDSLLVLSYPLLDLSVLSKEGRYIGQITQKGAGPGLLGTSTFVDVFVGDSGDIYVLRQDNAYALHIYSYKGEFKGKVNLFSHLPDSFSPTYYSNFHVIEDDANDNLSLVLSIGSTREHLYSKKFYQSNYGIAEFLIDAELLKVKSVKKHIPYRNDLEIKSALNKGKLNWSYPYKMFSFENEHFYVISNYSRSIKIYDRGFNLIKDLKINSLPKLKRFFSASFKDVPTQVFADRNKMQQRLQFENVAPWNIQVVGYKALIQLQEPQELNRHRVLSLEEQQNGEVISYENLLILIDLQTGKEKSYRLDKKYQGRVRLIDNQHFLIQGMPDESVEEIYIYKFKFR